jgi:hypothetical protein
MEATRDLEKELVEALMQLPDFDCLPIPQNWFKKYNIPARGVVNPQEFMESGYTMKLAIATKDLAPLIIDKPQQNGKLVPLVEPEIIPVEVVSRPFVLKEGDSFPSVLPFLKDHEPVHLKTEKDVLDKDRLVQ